MKVIVWTRYGPPEVLQLGDIPKPEPKDNEVLIKIQATTVSMGDCEMRRLQFPFSLGLMIRLFNGLRHPKRIKVLGQELAGTIEAVGKDVANFKPGDEVFASTDFFMGAYAQYKCLSESGTISLKPANLSFTEAASIPLGGENALHFLKQVALDPGTKILINGAGGSIGTMAVQLAKHHGAEVTAVDSADKLEMLRSLGADHVVDYESDDFTKSGTAYDVIFDIVGKAPYSGVMRSLSPNGVLLLGNTSFTQKVRGKFAFRGSGLKFIDTTADPSAEDLEFLKELVESGIIRPVIDRKYSLEQIPEAHRYVETGAKKGNVVITVSHNSI